MMANEKVAIRQMFTKPETVNGSVKSMVATSTDNLEMVGEGEVVMTIQAESQNLNTRLQSFLNYYRQPTKQPFNHHDEI